MEHSSDNPIFLMGWNDTENEIQDLRVGAVYELVIPLRSINRTNDPMDIASDYAWALHAAELLFPHVSTFSHRHYVPDYWHNEILSFSPTNIPGCKAAIKDIGMLFGDKENEQTAKVRRKANEFEGTLLNYPTVCFPDLGDSYLANYVNSIEIHVDEAELTDEVYKQFPTWRYYFWKSFLSQTMGSDVYASTDSWILQKNFDLQQLLKYLDWNLSASGPQLSPAMPIKIGYLPWALTSDSVSLELPYDCLNAAAQCWHNCLWNSSEAMERQRLSLGNESRPFQSDPALRDAGIHREYLTGSQPQEWFVSGDGSIVTVSFDDVTLLTFLKPKSKLGSEVLQRYLSEAEKVCDLLYPHFGLPPIHRFGR